MLKKKFFEVFVLITAVITVATAQTASTIYENNINSMSAISTWELKNIGFGSENNGQIVFGADGVATLPQLPEGVSNMTVSIQAIWTDWIYLHTSSDGVKYTNRGLFDDNGGELANSSKKIPDGTRFVRFVARDGTNNDVFLVSVRIRGVSAAQEKVEKQEEIDGASIN